MNQPHGLPGKYDPLNAYLLALPTEQTSVTLTFVELETLLGAALPASAWTTSFWASDPVAQRHWRRRGWHGSLDRPQRRVTFTWQQDSLPPLPRRLLDHAAILAAYQQGASLAETGRQFGITRQAVAGILRRAGVPQRPPPPRPLIVPRRRSPIDHHGISAAYQAGVAMAAIAAQFAVSEDGVRRMVQRVQAPRRSSGHPPRPDREAIIAAYQAGASGAELRARFGLSRTGVYGILRHAHVPTRTLRRPEQAPTSAAETAG